jgi:hypothetical protein
MFMLDVNFNLFSGDRLCFDIFIWDRQVMIKCEYIIQLTEDRFVWAFIYRLRTSNYPLSPEACPACGEHVTYAVFLIFL